MFTCCCVLFASLIAAPLPVAEVPAPVLLFGGGDLPDTIRDQFLKLITDPARPLVVIADDDTTLDPWKSKNAIRVGPKSTDLKGIQNAGAIWVQVESIDPESPVISAVVEAHQKGTPVGGFPSLPLLSGVKIVSHALERNRVDELIQAIERQPGIVGLAIDTRTGLLIQKRELRVIGESYAVVCLSAGNRRPVSVQILKSGSTNDLYAIRRAAITRSQPPFPADKPLPPVVAKGTLIIGGGGGMPLEVWKRFIERAGGPDAMIVVIPTALDDPIPAEPGEIKILRKAGATNLKLLHTRDPKEADRPEFCAILREAKGVWFSGGRQWRFVDAFEGTLTEQLLRDVLKRDGVIGGSSAGASIQSEYMPRGSPVVNTIVMAEGYERGFGYLPGVAVDQHFFARKREKDLINLIKLRPQLIGIGIDEGCAIEVRGSELFVLGKSRTGILTVSNESPTPEVRMEEILVGERYDLVARRKVGGR